MSGKATAMVMGESIEPHDPPLDDLSIEPGADRSSRVQETRKAYLLQRSLRRFRRVLVQTSR
jgi:hypothetical protein